MHCTQLHKRLQHNLRLLQRTLEWENETAKRKLQKQLFLCILHS